MPNLSELLIYNGETPLTLIIWSSFIGISLALIISFIIKVKFGAFVQTLLKMEATSPETAVTLEKTGLKRSFFVKIGLRSRTSYKNLIVAVTKDEKFYANDLYTDISPVFKEFVFQKRIRKKSRIPENTTEKNDSPIEESAIAMRLRLEKERAEKKPETETAIPELNKEEQLEKFAKATKELPKERVKFDISTAKYYIPNELHARAKSIYRTNKTLLLHVILGILALAVVALVAEPIINLLMNYLNDFISGLKQGAKMP